MTKNELATELAIELGEQADDLDTRTLFENWVQQAVDGIYIVSPWFFRNAVETVNTVASTATYALAGTVASIRDATIGTAHITYAPVERLIARGRNLAAEAQPEYWFYGGLDASNNLQITFQPIPDAAYVVTLQVIERPPTLASTDEIPLPPDYLQAIRARVRGFMAYQDRDYDAVQLQTAEYAEIMSRLAERYAGVPRPVSRLRAKGAQAAYQAPDAPGGA